MGADILLFVFRQPLTYKEIANSAPRVRGGVHQPQVVSGAMVPWASS